MTDEAQEEREWLGKQVAAYRKLEPRYRRYATVLSDILQHAAGDHAPLAIVQARAKTIASFAEKALRKKAKYADPVRQFTDLAGGRIIARNREEVEVLSRFIERHFEIDWDNSIDASQRLRPAEFGYRSVHYIVSLRPDVDYAVAVPKNVYGLKAEIQVRTMAEHAWADFAHDLSYKSAFDLPDQWKREIAIIAAELEDIERAFSRIDAGLAAYASSFGAYMSEEEMRREATRLQTVLEHDPENASLGWRIGRLAMAAGDWERAAAVMSRFVVDVANSPQPLVRDLGIALCRMHRDDPASSDYRRGRSLLEHAAAPEHRDAAAQSALADTWRRHDEEQARELYRTSFETDPSDWYPLAGYLHYEIRRSRSLEIVAALRPAMAGAIARCERQVEVGVNLPWALFGIGRLRLLMGKPFDAIRAYARAVQASTAAFPLREELDALDALRVVPIVGLDWARRLLLAGLGARFQSPSLRRRIKRISTKDVPPLAAPAVIVVGGTHPQFEDRMHGYRDLLEEAFRGFAGTVICGGTTQGISGVVGDVSASNEGVTAVGYLPAELPDDATPDRRYDELRTTSGSGFSPLEPLQNWIDLIASDVDPAAVRILGINGGDIAAIEYRIALALGARVGIVADSGRAAARLLADEAWAGASRLVVLPEDPQTVRAFLAGTETPFAPETLDQIGSAIHDAYRQERAAERLADDPVMKDWDDLPDDLQASNRMQAGHIMEKLREIGCSVHRVVDRAPALMRFTNREIETMAEMEHGRWTAERLDSGWSWGPERDPDVRTSPYLVSWADLPDEIREYDRETVRKIPDFLAAAGLEIRRDE